ncbi:MAG: hybrid sensor histidine kinase/response regulator, partial [Proteobacteria bacterium]|nr:hybrid sensor histidine kinase/response regulator [Pseudomonadota bacterium]
MVDGWIVLTWALFYLCVLFVVAHFGDTTGQRVLNGRLRPVIYALSLAVYCTSWTFLGSVGLASRSGYDFLPIYLGPALVFLFGWRVLERIVKIGKSQNTTSIADMIAARYGKSETVAAVVTIICLIGIVPYIALQLKAVSLTLELISVPGLSSVRTSAEQATRSDGALWVAIILAFFAMVFGTRNSDATKHQDGLILSVATESFVKLLAFLIVGIFTVWGIFRGWGDLFAQALADPAIGAKLNFAPDAGTWIVNTLIAAFAAVLLPRQFHVLVVENRDRSDVRRAAWMFPAYLVAINIFVVPIAVAGLLRLQGRVDADLTVLALPMISQSSAITTIAVVGALSAATAMIIVETVALSVMVSNDLVIPILLKSNSRFREARAQRREGNPVAVRAETRQFGGWDFGGIVLGIRRMAIMLVLLLGYVYYRTSTDVSLASIGLLSFAAVSQLAPAFFGGMIWHGGNARGAVAGSVGGLLAWFLLLLLPSFASSDGDVASWLDHGIWGIAWLRPATFAIGDLSPLASGVLISLGINILLYVGISLSRASTPVERLQANLFIGADTGIAGSGFRLWRSAVTIAELKTTVARYLGEERTNAEFATYSERQGLDDTIEIEADAHTIRFAEHLLASVIGAASSRLVLSLMLRRRNVSTEAALKLLDDASAAIQYSRTLLQHALDHAKQGVTVFDSNLRLVCWNHAFSDLFELPGDLVRFGVGLDDIVGYNARRGAYGPNFSSDSIAARLHGFVNNTEPARLRLYKPDRWLETRSNHLPDGGIVTTYTDISEAVAAEKALNLANETLERRVLERTDELTRVNEELARAKSEAEQANLSKTRFLAAASHDILQPLNAARLYATALAERSENRSQSELAGNVGSSLDAVEEILGALLEISRLDTGKLRPEWSNFRVDELFRQLSVEFAPLASQKNLQLTFIASRLSIRSDRRLLRRALQNLISNAIKYTPEGRVLVGARRDGDKLRIEVRDTGIGVPEAKQRAIFKEFQRLDEGAKEARGLGLGLSIVDRISRVLEHRIAVGPSGKRGTVFSLEVPVVSVAIYAVTPVELAPTASTPLAGLSVMAIDNEPSILDGLRVMLEGWGCKVFTASDFATARAQLKGRRDKPDIILADYHLDNDTTGIGVVQRLRRAFR